MRAIQLFIFSLLLFINTRLRVKATNQELTKGFSATPDSSISSFQSFLVDSTGDFSLGFLRVDSSQLALAVLHVPSSEPVWVAGTIAVRWSKTTRLLFNGSLVLSDLDSGTFWSTRSDGDRVVLMSNSNLQIQKNLDHESPLSVLWQSFDFPYNTLIENQTFSSNMSLTSSNGAFSMRLGDNYLGLYNSNQIYWKHTAMQAKAEIVQGEGPIYARISSNGFLGMFQNEKPPVDVLPFDSFQRPVAGIRLLRLETNGNLKGYFWNGSIWVLDFQAIDEDCELPGFCGPYGLCWPGKACACLDDKTEYRSGECFPPEFGDFCKEETKKNGYWVLRREGVELPYKELMGFEKMKSLGECESSCERNCSCWGSVYNNASGYCYKLNYAIETLVGIGDEQKFGYFKVRRVAEKKRRLRYVAGVCLLVGGATVLVGVAVYGSFKVWRGRRAKRFTEDGSWTGSYKDLGSASFRSIELCKS